ncbi:hypothetical protein JR316_0007782 [Psilocybe cubensis]|uniref:SWI5-dependent HO expression protein 3 n=2 Tax=Psilocybe cubensis TaxID=181762 RepID=A0A8H7XR06_PSICU|nr:hypothetical protein JR316_0007782 [Psilocybe cubensis]KAH9479196.1 hypothetical protein JR316_0007782 [Psilocybe cubensis]
MPSSPTKAANSSQATQNAYTTSEGALSPFKTARERSVSRPSSRSSLRTHSPSFSLDDPVSVRNHMSTLKHNIRQQQAQLNNLENIVRSGPRPYGPELLDDLVSTSNVNAMASSSSSTSISPGSGPSSYTPASPTPPGTTTRIQRRSSHDVLLSLAGPESNLPLPRRSDPSDDAGPSSLVQSGIREGIPSPTAYTTKRPASPTRTLSRIPVSAVGNARALAEEGNISISSSRHTPSSLQPDTSSASLTPGLHPPPTPSSPNKRLSLTPGAGGTTKVLADLQTGVVNARNALENTKAQLRLAQRSVAQLTRQTEDLKEGRERLRLENEGLNNVVARKERLLQEVLERARKAEAEAATLKSQLKSETSTSKKTIRELESSLAECTARTAKAEREYTVLRESVKGMGDTWRADVEGLRVEMGRREERVGEEAKRVGAMARKLEEEVRRKGKGQSQEEEEVRRLREEDARSAKEVEKYWMERVKEMKEEVDKESSACEEARKVAKHLSEELARLKRLMRSAGRGEPESGQSKSNVGDGGGGNGSPQDSGTPTTRPPPPS